MTFSARAKGELCRQPLGRKCCAQAEAYGVLLYCNRFDGREIRIVTESEEFARRRERQVMPESWVKGGWLARYQHLVSSADEGAILRDQF